VVVPTSRSDPYEEGYPRSSATDLDPGPDLSESLDDADRAASDEHRVVLQGRQLDQSTEDIRYDDADDADDGESRH